MRHWKQISLNFKLETFTRTRRSISMGNTKINQNLLSLVALTGWFNNLAAKFPKDINLQTKDGSIEDVLVNAHRLHWKFLRMFSSCHIEHPSPSVHMFTAMHIYFNFEAWRHGQHAPVSQKWWWNLLIFKVSLFVYSRVEVFFIRRCEKFKWICVIKIWKMRDMRLGTMKRLQKRKKFTASWGDTSFSHLDVLT
jgi:hypothetical protein